MKKKIVIVIILLVIALIAIIIPKSVFQQWFGNDTGQNDNLSYNILVYLEDENNRVVGVNVPVESLEEDKIRQKWDLMTVNSDLLPENFVSSLPKEAVLESYEVIENELILYTNDAIKEANGRKAMESIAWTFIDDEIEIVSVYVKDQKVNAFGDYQFKQIDKRNGINLNYETLYLYESNATTMIYYEDELVVPVTYFHLNEDVCSYIVNKVLDETVDNQYNYTIEDSVLTLDFVDASLLSTNQITTIVESIDFNLDVNSLNINNNENIFYQVVFNEIGEDISFFCLFS